MAVGAKSGVTGDTSKGRGECESMGPMPTAQGPATLRGLEDRDVPDVLALNEREVVKLAPLDRARLEQIASLADLVLVVELDEAFAGFVLTVGPGQDYDSENYRWFADAYGEQFYYLDRIVLTAATRRRGVGSQVYDVVEERARPFGRLTLEVNVEPPNPASLAFHAARGFTPVTELGDATKRAALLVKELARG